MPRLERFLNTASFPFLTRPISMDRVKKLRQCHADATKLRRFMEMSTAGNRIAGTQFSELLYRLRTGSCASVMDEESDYLRVKWEVALETIRNYPQFHASRLPYEGRALGVYLSDNAAVLRLPPYPREIREADTLSRVALGDMYSPVKQTITPERLRWLKYWQLPVAHVKAIARDPFYYFIRRHTYYPGDKCDDEA